MSKAKVIRSAKHWAGNAIDWSPRKKAQEEAIEKMAGPSALRRHDNMDKAGEFNTPAKNAAALRTAHRHDRARPMKSAIRNSGKSWGWFVKERIEVDPNLSKMSKTQQTERLIALFDELGEKGFKERFNL